MVVSIKRTPISSTPTCGAAMGPRALLLLLLTPGLLALPIAKEEPTCGYQSCPKTVPGKLNVHIVAHTHDDVGWLKTVDQYYYGSQTQIQKAGVQYIIDSVVNELLADPERRFIYVETSFLWKWWQEQTPERQQQVRQLINEGRLEIIGGAWSMNDEAAAHYHSIIDQFTWGLRKLNDTFGTCARPRIGWQIDPFGHSREMASLLSQMGYDGLFLGRLDYQDKSNRLSQKSTEMMWSASENLGASAEIFTHSLFNTYAPPPGFCFDVLCSDEPIIDDKRSPDYNVDRRVNQFLQYIHNQSQYYITENIILTMGEDFHYQNAEMWYKNLGKLMRYTNEIDDTVHAFYSTPGCYLQAVHSAGINLTEKTDDFFPYASDPYSYWTGYFTSRPTSKYFERQGNNFLQVCKQLHSVAQLTSADGDNIDPLREAMGIMQHHDAITGTEKELVSADYGRILTDGFNACQEVVNKAVNKLVAPSKNLEWSSCLHRNVSQCAVSEESDNFAVTIYNPLSRTVNHHVRIPVNGSHFSVRDPQGQEVALQIVPIPTPVLTLPERTSKATNEIVFLALNLPPLGLRTYYISKLDSAGPAESQSTESKDTFIKNEKLQVSLDEKSGLVNGIVNDGVAIPLQQVYKYYQGYLGNNVVSANRSSGAYIFRPNGSDPLKLSESATWKVYKGDLVEEIHQEFSDWVSQVVRVYKGENYAEFEWLVGPIPVGDSIGKEVVNRFSTELNTEEVFYTDANGREMLLRKRNYRPTWNLEVHEPEAGNYYPVTSKIVIRDEDKKVELAVLTDRAQGGSSLRDGELELMIHRRLLHDDAFGVGEALNEVAYNRGLFARGVHYVIAGAVSGDGKKSLAAQERELAQQKLLSPWLVLASAGDTNFQEFSEQYNMEFSGLQQALPSNVQILTLEPWKDGTLLLRLEHILEKGEDAELSKQVTVSLKALFSQVSVIKAQETTLDGNQWLEDNEKLQWLTKSGRKTHTVHAAPLDEETLSVTLEPMKIRTFVLTLGANQ